MSEVEVLRPAEAAQRLGVRTLIVIEAMYEKRVPRVRLADGLVGDAIAARARAEQALSIREAAEVAARVFVHRDQAVDVSVHRLLREAAFGGVVIDDRPRGMRLFHDPVWVAEGRDEEADAFLECYVDPLLHSALVSLGRGLDESVHADGFAARQLPDEAQAFAEVVAVDVGQGDGLDHAQAARGGNRGHELGIAAGVHGSAEDRRFHPRMGQETLDGLVVETGGHWIAIVTPPNRANLKRRRNLKSARFVYSHKREVQEPMKNSRLAFTLLTGLAVAGLAAPDALADGKSKHKEHSSFGEEIASWFEGMGEGFSEAFNGPKRTAAPFKWSGRLAAGKTVEVRGVNGPIRAVASSGSEVELVAIRTGRRHDPESVKIDVIQHDGGVTICAVYPSKDASRPNVCKPGGSRMNVRNNDVNVEFELQIPRNLSFEGRTVNGGIRAEVDGHGSQRQRRREAREHGRRIIAEGGEAIAALRERGLHILQALELRLAKGTPFGGAEQHKDSALLPSNACPVARTAAAIDSLEACGHLRSGRYLGRSRRDTGNAAKRQHQGNHHVQQDAHAGTSGFVGD